MRGLRTTKSAIWLVLCAIAAMLAAVACGAAEPEVVTVVETVVVTEEVVKEVEVPKEVVKEVEVTKEVEVEVVKEVPKEVIKEVEVVKEVTKEVIKEVPIERVVIATPSPTDEIFYVRPLDPFPKTGGVFRAGAHGPPAHFDWYASGTIANHGVQSPMYDALLRRDPRTPDVPVIPDLAYRWDISDDQLTYTFSIREGVKFHDGDDLTSEDIKATYDRIIFPSEELVSLRRPLFPNVAAVNAPDDYTIEFKLSEPRALANMMVAFSTEWNLVSKKETLEEHNGNLRSVDDHPGTGPFKYVSRNDDQWIMEKNVDYWSPDAPYIDRIEHIWLKAWTPENTAALLGNQTDWAMWLAPKDARDIANRPGLNIIRQHLLIWHGIPMNNLRKPFDDKRVRQAVALVLDQQALLNVTADIKATVFGGGWFTDGTPYGLPLEELKQRKYFRPPTEADIAEARALLAEAGYPDGAGIPKLDLVTRETISQRQRAPAIQAMLKEGLNIDTEIRVVDVSAHGEEIKAGNYDLSVEGGTWAFIPDPSFYIKDLFGRCGDVLCDGNTAFYDNPELDKMLRELEIELDQAKKLEMADDLATFLDQEMPWVPLDTSEITYWGYWDHVKGLMPANSDFYSNYELHKWDYVWLDRQ